MRMTGQLLTALPEKMPLTRSAGSVTIDENVIASIENLSGFVFSLYSAGLAVFATEKIQKSAAEWVNRPVMSKRVQKRPANLL